MSDRSTTVPRALDDFRYGSTDDIHAARIRISELALDIGMDPDGAADAALLASELMANALLHSGMPRPRVRLHVIDDGLRVAVTDTGHRLPVVPPRDPSRVGGNGLRIVDALAPAWGTEVHDGLGKTVWFTLPLTR